MTGAHSTGEQFMATMALLLRLMKPFKGPGLLNWVKSIYSGEQEKAKSIVDPWYQEIAVQ